MGFSFLVDLLFVAIALILTQTSDAFQLPSFRLVLEVSASAAIGNNNHKHVLRFPKEIDLFESSSSRSPDSYPQQVPVARLKSLSPRQLLLRPRNKTRQTPGEAYEERKQEWAARYTDVGALRRRFGDNKNKLWGDLDAQTSRRLYKTLLPKALMELYKVGVEPEDLAPLAYKARLAAKLYARERSTIPARLTACLYDGFRQWKQYGKFQTTGISYDQVWQKYTQLIKEENADWEDLEEDDVTAKICFKILESSCRTNEAIDRWVFQKDNHLQNRTNWNEQDISKITQQLEKDVRELLHPETEKNQVKSSRARRFEILRLVAKAERGLQRWKQNDASK